MHGSHQVELRYDERDWALFTSSVLVMSAWAKIASEELDALIKADSCGDQVELLRCAQKRAAALASIADHYNKGDRR